MRCFTFACICLLIPALALAEGPDSRLSVKGDNLVLTQDGKSKIFSSDEFPVQPIGDSPQMSFMFVSPDEGVKNGLKAGLYIFDSGKNTAFAPTKEAEFGSDVLMSPNRKIVAMSAGTSLIRDWYFYSYPAMNPLGNVAYYEAYEKPQLIWDGDKRVFYSYMDVDNDSRACGYDPCGPVSVVSHNFATSVTKKVLHGTTLCDYTLLSFADNEVTAEKLCLKNAKDWEVFPQGKPTEKVKVKIDDAAR